MLRSATLTRKPARRRAYKLFGLALILLAFALALPAGVSASMSPGGGGWAWQNHLPQGNHLNGVAVTAAATTFVFDATAAADGNVTGTVAKAGGGALDDIGVQANRYNGPGDWEQVAATMAAADGAYDLGGLPAGSYRISFNTDSGDYVTQYYDNKSTMDSADDVAVTAGATTANINATLAAAGHVSGTVSKAGGGGLSGINVRVQRANGSGGWEWVNERQTVADGTYDVGSLPTGNYRIEFYASPGGGYVTQFYNNKPTIDLGDDVAVTAGETTSGINATLAPGGNISGKVTKAGGAGIDGISVSAMRPDGSGWWQDVSNTQTNADGSYDLGGLPTGSYRIDFYDPSGAYVEQYYNNKPTPDAGDDVAVTAGATTSGINARLAPGGNVTGTVKNASAAGIGGIGVDAFRYNASLEWPWEGVGYTQTNADGTYDLGGLPAGNCRIQFSDDAGAYAPQYYNNKPTIDLGDDVAVTVGATTSGINATLAASGNVSGTVRNASGAGLGNISVSPARPDGSGGWEWLSGTQTNADGTYDLGGLPTGAYRIEFRDWSGTGYIGQYYDNKPTIDAGDDVAVTAGETTSGINATLAPGGFVSGTVTSAGGAGIGNFWVTALRSDGSGGWEYVQDAPTSADGAYSLGGLPTGTYRIEFRDYSGVYITQYYDNKPTLDLADDVAATVGATTPDIDATLVAAVVPTVTLKLSGLKSGAVKLGKSVTATGVVTPTSLAGSKVTLTVQLKKGSTWIKAKTAAATITAVGTYSWKYKPAKKGTYQMQASIAETATHAGAATAWLAFKVK